MWDGTAVFIGKFLLQREGVCTPIDLYSAFFPCFIPLLVLTVISFAFSFGLSYELCPHRALDIPFSFLMMGVPDPCWLPGRVKCRVALYSQHKACSSRHLVLLFISISVFLWNVLAESKAVGGCHTAVIAVCRAPQQVLTKPCKVWLSWSSTAPI